MKTRSIFAAILYGLVITSAQQVDVWTTNARSTNSRDHLRLSKRLLFHEDQSSGQNVVDVNEQTVYQTVDGFGITLSDSSAWLLWNKMSDLRREHLLRSLFDRKTGIGLNVVRISIGASEFSLKNYTYDDTCCDLSDFSIEHDKQYIIPILKSIKRYSPDLIIIGILWSPPAWMKVNNSTVGGKLRRDEYSNFATYLTKFVQAYNKEGLPIHSLVIQNEPLFKSCCYPSMLMDAREQAHIIKTKLGPVFQKYKLSTRIMIYGQDWEQVQYPMEILDEQEVKRYVGGVAFTCYGGTVDVQNSLYMNHPEQDIWVTECTDRLWNSDITFEPLFTNSITEDLVKPFRNYARGVLKNNLILNQNSGPMNGGCTDCLGMITLNDVTGNVTYNSAYYSLGHASKFVRSGARRIQSTTFTDDLDTVAFLNPDGTKILIVGNSGNVPKIFRVQWGNVSFSYSLDPSTAATFVWKGRHSPKRAYKRIEAESFSDQQGTELEQCTDSSGCGDHVGHIDSGDYLKYESVDFGEMGISSLAIRYASQSTKVGYLEIRLDAPDGKFIGLIQLRPTGSRQNWTTVTDKVRTLTGVRDLYLIFRGGDPAVGNVNWFIFNRPPNVHAPNMILNDNAVYKIVAMKSNRVLEEPNGQTTSTSGLQTGAFVNKDYQKFIFRSVSDGCYKIGLKHTRGLVLGFVTYGDAENTRIVQVLDKNYANQSWRIIPVKDGYFKITSCVNDKAWSLDETNNTTLHLSSNNSNKEQRFSIVSTDIYASAQEVSDKYWKRE